MSTRIAPTFKFVEPDWIVERADGAQIGKIRFTNETGCWMFTLTKQYRLYAETLAHIALKLFELNGNEDSTN